MLTKADKVAFQSDDVTLHHWYRCRMVHHYKTFNTMDVMNRRLIAKTIVGQCVGVDRLSDESIALRKSNWKAGTTAQQNLIHQKQTDWYKVMHVTERKADRAPVHEKYVLHLQPLGDTTAPTTCREIGSISRVTPDEPTI